MQFNGGDHKNASLVIWVKTELIIIFCTHQLVLPLSFLVQNCESQL